MQAIQCIHGLFVLNVLDELEAIFENYSHGWAEEKFLGCSVWNPKVYMTKMLSLLNMARWDAYSWQIRVFTFVSGLESSDVDFEEYKEHFKNHKDLMRANVSAFVSQCFERTYLTYRGNISSEGSAISSLVDGVLEHMILLYSRDVLNAYKLYEHFTVQNLMLLRLSMNNDFIFDWSSEGFELETKSVKRQLTDYFGLYSQQTLIYRWQLDPISRNKSNALILKCIQLKLVFYAWRHLKTYLVLRTRPSGVEVPMVEMWNTPVSRLTNTLREFGFGNENIYWSAIHIMRDGINKISEEELAAREEFTRKYFCQAAENLGLASASDLNQKLQDFKVPEDHDLIYKSIEDNDKMIDDYILRIRIALVPVDGTFIRIIVAAEGNETFVTH
ncbi:uncharacterized protein LOC126842121 [Adelges cooleyi]|uniref:uncharacterized protein LOC126842121 n=1 Tax=Adelges cooleyi TaxID=133065 RepID=UPI00217F57B9|nr:uncharacterized protein LOC126842121 [Adelges cooleyi]